MVKTNTTTESNCLSGVCLFSLTIVRSKFFYHDADQCDSLEQVVLVVVILTSLNQDQHAADMLPLIEDPA